MTGHRFAQRATDEQISMALAGSNTYREAAAKVGITIEWFRRRARFIRRKEELVIQAQKIRDGGEGQALDTMVQLVRLNDKAVTLLEKALKSDHSVAVRLMAEIRQQLAFQLDFMKQIHDVTHQAAFQKAILHEIGLVGPEVRLAIVKRLREWRQTRQLAKPD